MPTSITITSPHLVREWLLVGALIVIAFGLGVSVTQWLRARRDRALARARNARGRRGEARAAELLLAAGYEIVARQHRASYSLLSDAAPMRVGLSYDFIVAKDGQQWVAEVKTGALSTQLKHAETRRQLLEYQLASGAPQVLLVDPDHQRISSVSFPLGALAQARPRTQRVGPLLLCVALICVLALYLLAH